MATPRRGTQLSLRQRVRLAEKMTPGECEQARQEGVERMGFLNKGNCKCKGSEVKESKTLVGISQVGAHTMGRKRILSAGAVMKALFGELPKVCGSL